MLALVHCKAWRACSLGRQARSGMWSGSHTHGAVERAADADEVPSGERGLQGERNVSGLCSARWRWLRLLPNNMHDATGPKPGEIVKRGVWGDWAYRSAVGMLSSDECTQSNGAEAVQVLRVIMAWRGRWCEAGEEVVVRFGLLRGKGSAQGLESNVEQMDASPKTPRRRRLGLRTVKTTSVRKHAARVDGLRRSGRRCN
jgi:hypothetical protein